MTNQIFINERTNDFQYNKMSKGPVVSFNDLVDQLFATSHNKLGVERDKLATIIRDYLNLVISALGTRLPVEMPGFGYWYFNMVLSPERLDLARREIKMARFSSKISIVLSPTARRELHHAIYQYNDVYEDGRVVPKHLRKEYLERGDALLKELGDYIATPMPIRLYEKHKRKYEVTLREKYRAQVDKTRPKRKRRKRAEESKEVCQNSSECMK